MSGTPPARRPWAPFAVAAFAVAYAAAFITLSLLRHRGFFTARFDLGNMTQAVWSAANGDLFRVTDPDGNQISRLGAHVDPILGVFAPLWHVWPSPELLLVVQGLAVASAAVPAFLLARLWLSDDRLAVAFAAVTLLYPAIQWATLFDFHPVTLAAPLILWCIWAAATGRNVLLAIFAVAALLTKEQVGIALMVLGIWMVVALGRRRAGAVLAAGSLAWSVIAIAVIIPRFRAGSDNPFASRFGDLGSDSGAILRTLVTRPWEAVEIIATVDRAQYVLALILPVLALCLFAPLLSAGALPDLLINLLSNRPEQQDIEYHYGAVIAPFLIAGAIRGLAALRERGAPPAVRRILAPVPAAAGVIVAVVVGGAMLGPLPFWRHVPGGSTVKVGEYRVPERAALLSDAVAMVPEGAVVSAGNRLAAHLSDRRRILTFPAVLDAEWVVIDERQPDLGDRALPIAHAAQVRSLRARADFRVVSDRDGVLVLQRVRSS